MDLVVYAPQPTRYCIPAGQGTRKRLDALRDRRRDFEPGADHRAVQPRDNGHGKRANRLAYPMDVLDERARVAFAELAQLLDISSAAKRLAAAFDDRNTDLRLAFKRFHTGKE